MDARAGRPLLLIDIAVPRDIDPACGELDGRHALRHRRPAGGRRAQPLACARPRPAAPRRSSRRRSSASRAGWAARRACPTIAALREHADAIVEQVLRRERRRAGRRCRRATSRASRRWRARSSSRLLHEPTIRLQAHDGDRAHARLQLLRELFALDEAAARRAPPAEDAAEARELRRGDVRLARARVTATADRDARQRAGAGAGARGGGALLRAATLESSRSRPSGDAGAAASATRRAGSTGSSGRCSTAQIDLAVHSAKDVPAELAGRASARWACRRAPTRATRCAARRRSPRWRRARASGRRSLRRAAQLRALRADLEVVDLRGNVDTRLRKLADGEAATRSCWRSPGCSGSGASGEAGALLDLDAIVPAAGQGASRSRRAPATARPRGRGGDRRPRRRPCAWRPSGRWSRALDADLPHAGGALAARSTATRSRCARSSALPDGTEWVRDELDGGAADPEAVGRAVAERLRGRPAWPSCSRGPNRRGTPARFPVRVVRSSTGPTR